ncbi:ribosomal RNA small subunit methyltransferase G [Clostridia bacterium]|nr:ribosomal RNA small subunit methyltransferase G [Clostridia bacterium]GHU75803.1 ribosomal RNA small subunit methyltransferase G [Clostridia bacterium]
MSEQFEVYTKLLLEWNEKFNLTAITKPEEIEVKHYLDSLTLLEYADIPQNAKLIDIGTGAGFPGVPIKITRNDIELTLMDSLNKRIHFLRELTAALSLSGVTVLHARAEEAAGGELREAFDFAVSRAVAELGLLAFYDLAYVRVGGYFLAMKGGNCEEEILRAREPIKRMGGEIADIFKFELPKGGSRTIISVGKIRQTPSEFPKNKGLLMKYLKKR